MGDGDFYCDCPFCNTKISVPAELKNTLADCPVCKRNIMLVDRTNSKATQSISAVTTPATNPPQPPPAAPVLQKSQIAETEKEETTIWQSIHPRRVDFDYWDEPQPQKTENSTSSSNQQKVKLTAVQNNSNAKRYVDGYVYDELVKKQPEYESPWIVYAGYIIALLSLFASLIGGALSHGIGLLGLVPTLFTYLVTACVDRFFRENHYMLYDQRKIIVLLERMLVNMENGKK